MNTTTVEAFEELRPLLFSIAYRMLGSVAEAEDIVQETFVRYQRAIEDGTQIESPKAYLSATATRLAIDQLRSARVRRERYFGTWPPEPLVTDSEADAAQQAETADSLSLAFLVVLESLSPVERAVFLLREVFDYGYDEIARVVGKTEGNTRQLAVRARRRVEERKPRFEASRLQREELAQRFFAAAEAGDTDGLVSMLAADAVLYGDGGGKAPAVPRPIYGRERVGKAIAGWVRMALEAGLLLEPVEVNGQPGMRIVDHDGNLVSVGALEIADGFVQSLHSIVNPEKLAHLGPVADARSLLRQSRA